MAHKQQLKNSKKAHPGSQPPTFSSVANWQHIRESECPSICVRNSRNMALVLHVQSSPRNRMAAGIAARLNMRRQSLTGRATLTSSAARIPRQIISWFSEPSVPRTDVGETWGRTRHRISAW